MHELPYNPPDYGSSEGTALLPCRPTVKHGSRLQRKAYICELAGSAVWLRSLRHNVRVTSRRPHHCRRTRSSGDAFGPRSTRRFAPHRATLRVSRPFG